MDTNISFLVQYPVLLVFQRLLFPCQLLLHHLYSGDGVHVNVTSRSTNETHYFMCEKVECGDIRVQYVNMEKEFISSSVKECHKNQNPRATCI